MPTHLRNSILLATDQQRSVLSALNEHRPRSIAYAPYGHRPRENGLLSLLGFNGELPDPLTGCYHLGNGYRQFNPVLMRFNSPDSWSPFGDGGLNAYGYCGGDPRNREDRSGHASGWVYSLLGKTSPKKLAFVQSFNSSDVELFQPKIKKMDFSIANLSSVNEQPGKITKFGATAKNNRVTIQTTVEVDNVIYESSRSVSGIKKTNQSYKYIVGNERITSISLRPNSIEKPDLSKIQSKINRDGSASAAKVSKAQNKIRLNYYLFHKENSTRGAGYTNAYYSGFHGKGPIF